MTSKNLKESAIAGMLWSGTGNIVLQSLQFLFSIILARLLTPEDYGLTAILFFFYSLAMLFVDAGFTNALIRKKNITQSDLSTAFYFNFIVGLLCFSLLFFSAPYIASFYGKPLLTNLVRVFSLTLLFVPLMLVQNFQLQRKLDFKRISIINILSNFIANIIAVILAFCGWGVWSLIFMYVSVTLIAVIMYWKNSSWRPSWTFSIQSFKYILNFSYKLLFDGIVSTTVSNINNLVIGKVFSATSLGYYTKASTLSSLPSSMIDKTILSVSYPLLSKMQDDKVQLIRNYRRMVRMTAFLTFPLLVTLSAVARPLIILVYTEKWAPSIPYLQILCFSFMLAPILSLNKNILETLNRTDLVFKLRIINTICFLCIFFISIHFGISGLCIGIVISSFITYFVNTYYVGNLLCLKVLSLIKDIVPFLIISVLIGFIMSQMVRYISIDWIAILLSIIVGFTIYILIAYILKMSELNEVYRIIENKIKK